MLSAVLRRCALAMSAAKRIHPPYVECEADEQNEWQTTYNQVTTLMKEKGIKNMPLNVTLHNRKKGVGWTDPFRKKHERRILRSYKLKESEYDDLRFDPNETPLKPYVDEFKSREEFIRPTPIVYSRFLYNAVRIGECEEKYFKRLDTVLYHHEGTFPARFAFGALVASLEFNYDSMHFNEFMKNHLPLDISYSNFIELMTAAAFNLSAPLEWRQGLIVPILEKHLPQIDKKMIEVLMHQDYFRHLKRLELNDDKYWEPHLSRLTCKGIQGARRLAYWKHLGKLDDDWIKETTQFLAQDPNVRWRFNLQQGRFYTNQQMMNKSQQDIQPIRRNSFYGPGRAERANQRYLDAIDRGSNVADEQRNVMSSKKMLQLIESKFYENSEKRGNVTPSAADPEFLAMIGITEEQWRADLKEIQEELESPGAAPVEGQAGQQTAQTQTGQSAQTQPQQPAAAAESSEESASSSKKKKKGKWNKKKDQE